MKKHSLLFILWGGFFLSPLFAAFSKKPVVDPPLPKAYTSKNFVIFTKLPKKYAKKVAQVLEVFRGFFLKGFSSSRCFGKPLKILPPEVYIFSSRKEYQNFCRKHKPAFTNREAFFDWWWEPGMKTVKERWHWRLISFHRPRFATLQRYLIHELTHIFLNYYLDEIPLWLDEGIATYMETVQIRGQRLIQGIPAYGFLRAYRQAVRERRQLSLKELLKLGPDDDEKFTSLHYAQSWALVHYLLRTRQSVKTFWRFLKACAKDRKYYSHFVHFFLGKDSPSRWKHLQRNLERYIFLLK